MLVMKRAPCSDFFSATGSSTSRFTRPTTSVWSSTMSLSPEYRTTRPEASVTSIEALSPSAFTFSSSWSRSL